MNGIIWVVVGGSSVLLADWLLAIWRRVEAQRRRTDALAVLKTHGLAPVLYLAPIGVEDAGLQRALDEFAFSGHIIQTSEGTVVGRLAGLAMKAPRRSHLRLVISSTGKD